MTLITFVSVSISGVIGKRAEAYSPYAAPEYISNFSSKINIEKDGSLIVTEDIAVITNILPDHLNRYASMAEYIESKKIIFKYQKKSDILILNSEF